MNQNDTENHENALKLHDFIVQRPFAGPSCVIFGLPVFKMPLQPIVCAKKPVFKKSKLIKSLDLSQFGEESQEGLRAWVRLLGWPCQLDSPRRMPSITTRAEGWPTWTSKGRILDLLRAELPHQSLPSRRPDLSLLQN